MESRLAPALLLSLLIALDARLLCWQALLRCHADRECELAYGQYLSACDGILRGSTQQCPSHCISALIRLNQTLSGTSLEDCHCAGDAECMRAKSSIEPCMPRKHPSGIGCTEARQRCEEEPRCRSALTVYLSQCGQLFNGRKCTHRCRATIEELLELPNGVALNQCVCDGLERPFCEVVKHNMEKLCAMGDGGAENDEDLYEDEDEESEGMEDQEISSSSTPAFSRISVSLGIAFTLASIETL